MGNEEGEGVVVLRRTTNVLSLLMRNLSSLVWIGNCKIKGIPNNACVAIAEGERGGQ